MIFEFESGVGNLACTHQQGNMTRGATFRIRNNAKTINSKLARTYLKLPWP